jgi:hypothetical protein
MRGQGATWSAFAEQVEAGSELSTALRQGVPKLGKRILERDRQISLVWEPHSDSRVSRELSNLVQCVYNAQRVARLAQRGRDLSDGLI